MLEGVLKVISSLCFSASCFSFNPWYVGGGVKRIPASCPVVCIRVSILGMLEGVLKALYARQSRMSKSVSILGMLEGVLKVSPKSAHVHHHDCCFNPWYVGGGVKSVAIFGRPHQCQGKFQSLVCWRGC